MVTRRVAALLGAGFALPLVVGCGGGGVTPGVDVQGETVQTFRIDFANNTVTVIETPVDSPAKVDTHPGGTADMALTLTVKAEETGNPGFRHVDATVANNGSSAIGINAASKATGVDLCVTSLTFRRANRSTVDGGGMGGYHSLNALTELPVYRIGSSVDVGATAGPVTLAFQLPKNVVTADIGIEVRADSAAPYWPGPGDRHVTTIAGHPTQSGFVNGPLGAARFRHPTQLLVREGMPDVLVADYVNGAIREISGDTVSTLTADPLNGPMGIAADPAGNLIISDHDDNSIYLVTADSVTKIAGTDTAGDTDGAGDKAEFKRPSFLASVGDDTYVTDGGNKKLKRITYDGSGLRSDPTNYTVTTVYTGTNDLNGVAVDGWGNVFFCDFGGHQVRVLPAGSTTTHVVAGTGSVGSDDGRGNLATLVNPGPIAVDEAGTLYVGDWAHAIRRIRQIGPDITQATNWKVETLIGYGTATDGGEAGALQGVRGIDIARDGTLWISDGHAVRRIDKLVN